ncbi:MAG: hypothetical protein AAB340_02430 [Patescibacteria group bacterium]
MPDATNTAFWESRLFPCLKAIQGGCYSIPEIQALANSLDKDIHGRYQANLGIDATDTIFPSSLDGKISIPMGCCIRSGTPTVLISIPIWMRTFKTLCGGNQVLLETVFLVAFLHELIHLARGLVVDAQTTFEQDSMLAAEEVVNAETCNVMEIFIKNGRRLIASDQEIYDAWTFSGKNQHSDRWKQFIRKRYGWRVS